MEKRVAASFEEEGGKCIGDILSGLKLRLNRNALVSHRSCSVHARGLLVLFLSFSFLWFNKYFFCNTNIFKYIYGVISNGYYVWMSMVIYLECIWETLLTCTTNKQFCVCVRTIKTTKNLKLNHFTFLLTVLYTVWWYIRRLYVYLLTRDFYSDMMWQCDDQISTAEESKRKWDN